MRTGIIPLINLILFIITVVTTLIAGSLQQGVNLLENPWLLWKGMPFSFTLLLILGSHELGHYFMSKRHHIDVTLPYFIPAPSLIGTFGAFIKMRSPVTDRRILLDIGAAGPLAGLIVAIPVIFVGLSLSKIVPETESGGIHLGASILFSLINWLVHGFMPENTSLILHPVAFSGWIGFLVTSLNLLPVGQLDGGHVAYAIFGFRQRAVARVIMVILLVLGITGWSGWLVWAVLLYFMGINHPQVAYEWIPLDRKRKVIGCLTLIVFLITFSPVPF